MPTITFSQLDARVLDRLDGNSGLYPPQERATAINEALKILNVLTGFYQAAIPLPYSTQSNRIWYDVPPNIVIPTRVQINQVFLRRSSFLQTGRGRPSWVTETTANQVSQVSSWIPFGLSKFAIHPADAMGGNQMTVTGIVNPPVLVNPNDTVNLTNWLQTALNLYAAHILQLKESQALFSQASNEYLEFMKLVKKHIIWRSFISPAYHVAELQQSIRRK